MKMGVSEVARILGVDRNLVKKWVFHFKEHLTQEANPSKGTPRQFTPADLQVFAYVSTYWEDDPDFENIEAGLNCGDHQREPYDDLLTLVTPLFQEPPEELDETWRHGSLIGIAAKLIYYVFDIVCHIARRYKAISPHSRRTWYGAPSFPGPTRRSVGHSAGAA
jgi:hypothetical protein